MSSNPTVAPLRLLIADGSAAIAEGLAELIENNDDIEIVGTASKAIEALVLIEKLHPDTVLLDIEMPGETLGFVLNLIHQSPRPPRILVLIPYSSLVLKERCLDAGADYVFTKTADLDRIVEVLQKLAAEKGEKE